MPSDCDPNDPCKFSYLALQVVANNSPSELNLEKLRNLFSQNFEIKKDDTNNMNLYGYLYG